MHPRSGIGVSEAQAMNPLQTAAEIIRDAIAEIRGSIQSDMSRHGLLGLTRVADTKFATLAFMSWSNEEASHTLDGELFGKGFPFALALYLDESTDAPGMPLFPMTENFTSWADQVIRPAGAIVTLGELMAATRRGYLDVEADAGGGHLFHIEARAWSING